MANPKPITIKNAGATINSNLDDKRPTLTADMKTIVFTSRREEGKMQIKIRRGMVVILKTSTHRNGIRQK